MPGVIAEEQKLEMPVIEGQNTAEKKPDDFWSEKKPGVVNKTLETATTEIPKETQNNLESNVNSPETNTLSSEQTEEIKKKTEETLETLKKARSELKQEHNELVTYEKLNDDKIASLNKELKELLFRRGLMTDMRKKLEDQAKELGIDLNENSSVADNGIENKFRSSNLQ